MHEQIILNILHKVHKITKQFDDIILLHRD